MLAAQRQREILTRIVKIDKPATRVYYDLQEIGYPDLGVVLDDFLQRNL